MEQLYAGWSPSGPLGDLQKFDTSAANPTWVLTSPTGDIPGARNSPSFMYGGNGMVYMMGGRHIGGINTPHINEWTVYSLDTKPTRPVWTKLIDLLMAPLGDTGFLQYSQTVWDNHLYVTVSDMEACNWLTGYKLNLSNATHWSSVPEMYYANPCREENQFALNDLIVRQYQDSSPATFNYTIFDLKTLGMVRFVCSCMHVLLSRVPFLSCHPCLSCCDA